MTPSQPGPVSLTRFHTAQTGSYDQALAEIRRGLKTNHWIWYVFPQIEGLGHSATARTYALRDLAEAQAYLRDNLLRQHYLTIARAVRHQLDAGVAVAELMGSQIDALKLVSSLTLFQAAARSLTREGPEFAALAEECDVLLADIAAQGYPPCRQTAARLCL